MKTLSEKIMDITGCIEPKLEVEDVKEFIKELKEFPHIIRTGNDVLDFIDKLAGEKLI